MSLKRCPSCNGKKKVAPLGFIEKDCNTCKGIGFINSTPYKETSSAIKDVAKIEYVLVMKKKRGRPPRESI